MMKVPVALKATVVIKILEDGSLVSKHLGVVT